MYKSLNVPMGWGVVTTTKLISILAIIANSAGSDQPFTCPNQQPIDLQTCDFDSSGSGASCDYVTDQCCPDGGECAVAKCQCLLGVFLCIHDTVACPELCPPTRPSEEDTCDIGFAIDCHYGNPFTCNGGEVLFPGTSECYCSLGLFECVDFACSDGQSDPPLQPPVAIPTSAPSVDSLPPSIAPITSSPTTPSPTTSTPVSSAPVTAPPSSAAPVTSNPSTFPSSLPTLFIPPTAEPSVPIAETTAPVSASYSTSPNSSIQMGIKAICYLWITCALLL